MGKDAAELLAEALRLPTEARTALADSLIGSLDENVDEDAEEAWRSEIAQRVQDLDSGRVRTAGWDEVRRPCCVADCRDNAQAGPIPSGRTAGCG